MTKSPSASRAPQIVDAGGRPAVSRRSVLHFGGIVGMGGLLAPVLAACGVGPTGGSGSGGGASASTKTLTLALNRSLVSIDNKLNQFDAAVTVQRAVRQALTAIGQDLTVQNVLAESFELTSPTVWTVKLRSGIKYSDGSPVAIEDVSTALDMYKQVTAGFVGQQFPEWPVVAKVDDTSFTLTTKNPLLSLNSLMSNILITPAKANKPEELQDGVGTGPYKVESSDRGTGTYVLVKNENYWGTPAKIEKVNVKFISEESSRVAAVRSGDVDVIDSITVDSANQLKTLKDVKVEQIDGTRICQLYYNFRKPAGHPLADPKVREALSWAVDGPSIIKNVLGGAAVEATGVVSQALVGFAETGKYQYDPAKAKSTLASLGADNLKLKLIWETGEFAADSSVMEALVDMFKAVGVTLTLQEFAAGGDIPKWRSGQGGDWDLIGNGYGNQTGLALTSLVGEFGSTAAMEKTHDAFMGFVRPEISGLLTKASSETDEAKGKQLLRTAQQKIWAEWPVLWAFTPQVLLARRATVEGLALKPINSYDLAAVS